MKSEEIINILLKIKSDIKVNENESAIIKVDSLIKALNSRNITADDYMDNLVNELK